MNIAPLESVLLSLESGARPKGGVSADSGEIPSLGGEHVNSEGGFDFTNIKRIPRSFFETMRGGRIAQSDILVVKDGATTGKTSFVRDDFPFSAAAVNEHVFCVRVDSSKASPAFVYHFLRSERGQKAIQLDFRGATVGGISREFATKTRVPLPPLAEQRRIAEVLDRAEALRAKRRAALAQLDSLTQSLFLDLFGDPIPNERDWPVSPIGELDIQIADGNYSSKYPTSSEFVESGVPFIRANNLRDMTVVADDMRFISPAKHHELQKGHLAEGDVLITTRGDIGNIAVVPRTFHDANINAQIVLLRPNPTHLDSRYLAYLLDLPQMKIRIQSFQNGVALKQLPIRQLVRISVPVPPIPLQREFARRVTAVEALKTAQRASLAELDALFATLQHRAFKGEL